MYSIDLWGESRKFLIDTGSELNLSKDEILLDGSEIRT